MTQFRLQTARRRLPRPARTILVNLCAAFHGQPMDLIDPRSFDAAGKVLWMPSIITGLLYVSLCALVYHSVATSIARDGTMNLSTFAAMWESVFKIALLALNYILVGVAFITHAKSQVTGFSLGGMAGFILGTVGGWLFFVPTGWYAFFMISSISGGLIGSSLRFGKRPKREKSKEKEEDLHGS